MGFRLSKIITRTGDAGSTGLGDGSRTEKDSLRIEAIGEVDELNSSIGILLSEPDLPLHLREMLLSIQHDLFDLGGELCLPGKSVIALEQVARLEEMACRLNEKLPALDNFILPGGSRPAALAYLCRAICRRAERAMVRLHRQEPVSENARCYINRLSDLLFILGRAANQALGQGDILWQKAKNAALPPEKETHPD